jgi:hypothetical protein
MPDGMRQNGTISVPSGGGETFDLVVRGDH